MNPRDLAGILETRRAAAYDHLPWVRRPSTNHIALGKDRAEHQDWFTVSPALYETINELRTNLDNCFSAILDFEEACAEHGIEGGR